MSKATKKQQKSREELRDLVLAERKNGNVVCYVLPGQLMVTPLDQFVEQPADGLLYDLNRGEEVSLTFLGDPKWVNDFAVALTIRKLMQQRDEACHALALARGE